MTKFKYIWQEHEFVLSFGSSTADENALLDEALDFPQQFAKSKRKRMVFAIDEFGELNNWGKELLKKMRAKFQRHDLVTYIFSGSQESLMKKLFTDKAQAFYGFGKIIPLGPLPQDDLAKYLLKTFNKGGVRILAETIQFICQLANNHPHYSKILSQTILDQIGTRKEVKVNDVKEGYERALFQVKGELDREWENLSKASFQRRVLKFLALEKRPLYSKNSFPGIDKQQIYLALSELQAKGIISWSEEGQTLTIDSD